MCPWWRAWHSGLRLPRNREPSSVPWTPPGHEYAWRRRRTSGAILVQSVGAWRCRAARVPNVLNSHDGTKCHQRLRV